MSNGRVGVRIFVRTWTLSYILSIGLLAASAAWAVDHCGSAAAYLSPSAAAHFRALPAVEDGFRDLSPWDARVLKAMLAEHPPTLSGYSFANLWAWNGPYGFQAIRFGEAVILKASKAPPGKYHTLYEPIGVPPAERARLIREFLKAHPRDEHGTPFVFRNISRDTAQHLKDDPALRAENVPGKAEYVYESRSLATLNNVSKRRSNVRNFFRDFPDKGPEPRSKFVALHELSREERLKLMPQIEEFLNQWIVGRRGNDRRDFADEIAGTRAMLNQFDSLGMKGGVLMVDGKVVAFTLGKQINPTTLVVYSEKAIDTVADQKAPTYQAINQRFALHMLKESLRAQILAVDTNRSLASVAGVGGAVSDVTGSAGLKAAAHDRLRQIELWEEMEGLESLSVSQAMNLLKDTRNLGIVEAGGLMPLPAAMARWKEIGGQGQGQQIQNVNQAEADRVWEALKLWQLHQSIKLLEKKGIPEGRLSTSKDPNAVQLWKAIEALRELRANQAYYGLAKNGPGITHINRQEHGGDDGHQGAKDRYVPAWMEENWSATSSSNTGVSFGNVYEDEQ